MNITIPKDSIFRPAPISFTATFNAPTLGKYDFEIAGNQNIKVLDIDNQNLYFIAGVNFGATVPESAWLENLEVTPSLRFQLGISKQSLDGGYYAINNYLKSNPVGTFVQTKDKSDTLQANFLGVLTQNAALVTFSTIKAIFSYSIFEIHNQSFIREFDKIPPGQLLRATVEIPEEIQRRL